MVHPTRQTQEKALPESGQIQNAVRIHKAIKMQGNRAVFFSSQCFKGAWVMTVLHRGFGFSENVKNFRGVSTIGGQEVQWTLGAILYKLRYFPLRYILALSIDMICSFLEEGEKILV